MRLVGIALLAAWMVAWGAAPHGEPARSTSIVGAVACAGGDTVAAAWLELRHGAASGTLHALVVDRDERTRAGLDLVAGLDAVGFKLADAGDGTFVLAGERRTATQHAFSLHRFGGGRHEVLPPIAASTESVGWQIAAAGDELVLTEALPGGASVVHLYDAAARVWSREAGGPTLVGAGGGHVVRYERLGRNDRLVVAPGRPGAWSAELSRPDCALRAGDAGGSSTVTVTSVVGLRGGYARLSRRGPVGCVDGIRDGVPFAYRDLPLGGIASARLAVDGAGRLSVHEEQDAQLTERRVLLPADPGGHVLVDGTTIHPRLIDGGVRYRLFAGDGSLGVTDLATRVTASETQVVLERQGSGGARVLAPSRRYEADARPLLRRLALLPLGCLALALAGALRLSSRVRRLRPAAGDAPLTDGPAVVAGRLVRGADRPVDGLVLRAGRQLLTLYVEGADVLRASDVRPRSQPRGDAVDVAADMPVAATGVVEAGTLYRDDARMRARRGDLVVVGASLAEVSARLSARAANAAALLAFAAALVLAVAS